MIPSKRLGLRSSCSRPPTWLLAAMILSLLLYLNSVTFLPSQPSTSKHDSGAVEDELTLEQKVKRDFQVAILTTSQPGFQGRKLPYVFETWMKGFEDIVHVISDSDFDTFESGAKIPGYVNAMNEGCKDKDRHWGLICKNRMYLTRWKPMTNKKWFYRGMDDSYIHWQNMMEYVATLDHTKPYAIGDRWCHSGGWTYPSGGPGILFSRGFIDQFDLARWEQTPSRWRSGDDDVSWGGYIKDSNVILTHHHGISQTPPYRNGEPTKSWQHMQSLKQWNLPFKPVAWHLEGHSELMPRLHEEMSRINFSNVGNVKPDLECKCFEKVYHRCVPKESLIPSCKDGSWAPECFVG